jgi:hypothetical protein
MPPVNPVNFSRSRYVFSSVKSLCYTRRMSRLVFLALILLIGCRPQDERTPLRVWGWWSPVEGERMSTYFRGVEESFG